jgi:hypothetical protein
VVLKQFALLLAFVLVRVPGLAQALDQDQRDAIEQRRQLVESGSYLQAPQQGLVAASASSLAEAMDIDPSLLADASAGGAADGLGVLASLGTIRPLRGASFAVLSSGQVATVSEPGTDFLPEGVAGDTASLVLTL